jgi:hypothetical protein
MIKLIKLKRVSFFSFSLALYPPHHDMNKRMTMFQAKDRYFSLSDLLIIPLKLQMYFVDTRHNKEISFVGSHRNSS